VFESGDEISSRLVSLHRADGRFAGAARVGRRGDLLPEAPLPMKTRAAFLLPLALLAAVLHAADDASPAPASPEYTRVVIASTTDLHGRIYPVDYFTELPFEGGLAKISTVVGELRRESPGLLLVDSGDTIEGNPLAYFHAQRNNGPTDPMMLVMSRLGYDEMTLGNHDFNYGLAVQSKAQGEAKFPWLSANIYRTDTGKPAYTPYLVKTVNGVRIGLLGLTTPGIPFWDAPENYRGMEFHDPLPEARKWVAILRNEEHVDAVVVTMHMGLELIDLATGGTPVGAQPNENRALAIANEVPGIDLILMGHTHKEIPALVVNGVLLAQAGRWGDHVIKAELFFSRPTAGAPWHLTGKQTAALTMRGVKPDPAILELTKSYHEETEQWLSRPIGTCDKEIDSRAIFADSAMLDLVHRVQLEVGGADVSLASIFNPKATIHAGPVTVRDLAGLYVYDNTLVVIQVTGAQLKDALEHSARFLLPYQPGKTLNELIDPRVYSYNFDKAAGVSYELDIRRPYGDRIQHLTYQGAPLAPDKVLKLAVNSYRYNGGGRYDMLKGAPVLYRSSISMRDLMIDWVEKHHTIPTEPMNNWRIVGVAADTKAPVSDRNITN
jgi:2',3'-cyclic-nucleotide 2'-phosphodiesterase/3'-nucleotidase